MSLSLRLVLQSGMVARSMFCIVSVIFSTIFVSCEPVGGKEGSVASYMAVNLVVI